MKVIPIRQIRREGAVFTWGQALAFHKAPGKEQGEKSCEQEDHVEEVRQAVHAHHSKERQSGIAVAPGNNGGGQRDDEWPRHETQPAGKLVFGRSRTDPE